MIDDYKSFLKNPGNLPELISYSPSGRPSLTRRVEDRLKCALTLGYLKPGDKVVTKNIADAMKMSVTPVRESLIRLSASSALALTPSHAFFVPVITSDQFNEYMRMRRLIEPELAEKAVLNMDDQGFDECLSMCQKLRSAYERRDVYLAHQLNLTLRLKLYIHAGLPEFFKIVTQLWINLGPTLSYTFESDSEEKWPIFFSSLELALSNRDAGAAADAIRESLDKGLRIYLSLLTEQGE
ncbi:TPA: FCD domain-containing protein [Klebsiella michiganensis]